MRGHGNSIPLDQLHRIHSDQQRQPAKLRWTPHRHGQPRPQIAIEHRDQLVNQRPNRRFEDRKTCQKPFLATMTAALLIAARLLPVSPLSPGTPLSTRYYNVDDHCVESPDYSPGVHDRDGTNSHSEHRQGSGSWHGGTGGHSRK